MISTKRREGGYKVLDNLLDVYGWLFGIKGGCMIFADIHIYIKQISFFLVYVKISYIICRFWTVALISWDLINSTFMMETHKVQTSFVKISLNNVCLLSCHFITFMRLADTLKDKFWEDLISQIGFFASDMTIINWQRTSCKHVAFANFEKCKKKKRKLKKKKMQIGYRRILSQGFNFTEKFSKIAKNCLVNIFSS